MITVVDLSAVSGVKLTRVARQIGISRPRTMTDEDLRAAIWARQKTAWLA